MADVRPFRALRYDAEMDLALTVAPPFDTITPEHQRELYARSEYNAVRIELALDDEHGTRYENAARTLHKWIAEGILLQDHLPAFYILEQTFEYGGQTRTRRLLFARVRVVPWSEGAVLPHEQTFPKHKEDRLQLYRAAHINASPVFMFYRDAPGRIAEIIAAAEEHHIALEDFTAADGQHHELIRIDNPSTVHLLEEAFATETLYIADGHHRFETALLYRDEVKAARDTWTGDEPENFALVGLVAEDDPGMLVLPTHRLTRAKVSMSDVRARLEPLFNTQPFNGSAESLEAAVDVHDGPAFGLASADGLFLLTVRDPGGVDALLPQDRSEKWRALDYAIANHVIMGHGLGLSEDQMRDGTLVWFTEDARTAVRQVNDGDATYAILMKPASVTSVLDIADAGERMPQKSTYFYPKAPTGLVFNLLEE